MFLQPRRSPRSVHPALASSHLSSPCFPKCTLPSTIFSPTHTHTFSAAAHNSWVMQPYHTTSTTDVPLPSTTMFTASFLSLPCESKSRQSRAQWSERDWQQPRHFRHKSRLWKCFLKQITSKVRKPPPASQMSSYVPNVMGLFYFTLMQNQRFHYSTETNILQGHEKMVWDMQDVMYKLEGQIVSSNMTLHCRWGTHLITLQNWTETWHKHDNFQACLQAPPSGGIRNP